MKYVKIVLTLLILSGCGWFLNDRVINPHWGSWEKPADKTSGAFNPDAKWVSYYKGPFGVEGYCWVVPLHQSWDNSTYTVRGGGSSDLVFADRSKMMSCSELIKKNPPPGYQEFVKAQELEHDQFLLSIFNSTRTHRLK